MADERQSAAGGAGGAAGAARRPCCEHVRPLRTRDGALQGGFCPAHGLTHRTYDPDAEGGFDEDGEDDDAAACGVPDTDPPRRPYTDGALSDYVIVEVVCPNCRMRFGINYDGPGPSTLRVSWCLSGGIYGVAVSCPHCGKDEDVW